VRSRWDKTVFAFESLVVERVGELVELNDGVAEFTTLETSIEVVIANARRIIDFFRSFGRTSSSHEGDCIDGVHFKKPQSVNCVRKFILSIVVVFGLGSDLCHVFGLNIKDDIGDGFGTTRSRQFSGKLPLCPIKHLFGGVTRYGIVDGDRYKLELLRVCWTGSIWMSMVEVFHGILGICNVRHRLPSLFLPQIALPMDKVLHLFSSKS